MANPPGDGKQYYTYTKGHAQFFALDSTYMSPLQLAWLEKELQTSKADWKISNVSDATGQQERIAVFTVLLRDASLFHALGVAPRDRFSDYEATFRKVVGSIQFME